MNPEFVGAARLKKLLAGELEPSGVKEKGLGLASSVSAGGIVNDRGDPVSMVDDAASWSSIDGHVEKRPFTRGCFFQDITAILGLLRMVVRLLCNGLYVKSENVVVRWYASSQGSLFRVSLFRRYVVSQACRSIRA